MRKVTICCFLRFQKSWTESKNQLLRFQNRVTIQIVIWNRMYCLSFLHFANFSPFSSHTLPQTIVSIQRYRYRAFHIRFKRVASLEVTLALKAAPSVQHSNCVLCVIFLHISCRLYMWYYHLFCIYLLISSSETYLFHYKIHSHYLPFLQVIVVSVSKTTWWWYL